jgi:cysteine desulfurase/selenocysteine lyase
VAFGVALEFTNSIGKEKIRRHEDQLLNYATDQLEALDGLRIIGRANEKVSLISFVIEGVHPQDLGILLDNRGIAVRTGHHCAQPLMDRYCIPGTTRASFAMYNTLEEVDQLVVGLQKAIKMLR